MAFGLGERYQTPAAPEPGRPRQIEVACDCWFTSQGRTIPKMIKFPDENGQMQTVKEIRVLCCESKHYAGVSCVEYDCEIGIAGRLHRGQLIFYSETCRWVLCM